MEQVHICTLFNALLPITIKFSRKYIMSQFPPPLKLGGGGLHLDKEGSHKKIGQK